MWHSNVFSKRKFNLFSYKDWEWLIKYDKILKINHVSDLIWV